MKKEVLLAVLVGFGLGLIITFGIWTANKNLKGNSSLAQNISPTPTPPSTPVASDSPALPGLVLNITSPEDESISPSTKSNVSGKTAPGAVVAVTGETTQQITLADQTGSFSAEVDLEGGYNRILITAFDKDGNSTSREIVVTYTTSKI